MSFVADIFGAYQADKGQRRAANAASQASAASLAEQKRQFDLSRTDMQPWLTAGTGALGQLSRLYGLGGGSAPTGQAQQPQSFAMSGGNSAMQMASNSRFPLQIGGNQVVDAGPGYVPVRPGTGGQVPQPQPGAGQTPAQPSQPAGQFDTFWQSPDYQFRMNESLRALTARNAALGIQDSGAAQRSALGLAGNLASSEYNNYANRLAALAGVGQTAAQNNANLGQNYAGAVQTINQNQANALGSSYVNRGNIWGNLVNNLNGQVQQAGAQFFGGFG